MRRSRLTELADYRRGHGLCVGGLEWDAIISEDPSANHGLGKQSLLDQLDVNVHGFAFQ